MLRKNGLNLNTPDRFVAKNIRIIKKNITGNRTFLRTANGRNSQLDRSSSLIHSNPFVKLIAIYFTTCA